LTGAEFIRKEIVVMPMPGVTSDFEHKGPKGMRIYVHPLAALSGASAANAASEYLAANTAPVRDLAVQWDADSTGGEVVAEAAASKDASAPAVELARFTWPGASKVQAITVLTPLHFVRFRVDTALPAGTVSSTDDAYSGC
jgi:hypothetical protein